MSDKVHFPGMAGKPGENFEPRQTFNTDDAEPDTSKSLPLSPARQRLIDDIIALYSCEPTVERVKRYTPDCVYDDQFVYANDRYKMAGQWFALPKFFTESINHCYQIIVNDRDLIQFKNAQVSTFVRVVAVPGPRYIVFTRDRCTDKRPSQSWNFKGLPKTARINAIVSLSLDPDTVDSDFIQVKVSRHSSRLCHAIYTRVPC